MANTGTPAELAHNGQPTPELELLEDAMPEQDLTQEPTSFPPYPPYVVEPEPPSVADTVITGHGIRRIQKSIVKPSVYSPPKPALPRGPKATDVKLKRRALKAHERCLRRHGRVLTDHLERISKPRRRTIIYLWREFAHTLPSETIARLRAMLDADEPFKPDQAYEYFINLKKRKKKNATNSQINELKKDILSMYGDKRFMWARNATVSFARGIQHKLSKPGRYVLADGMLRLSNIVLDEICGYMHMRTPSRRNNSPKAKFMMEMADKVAVWVDEILAESDDRMLMMDFDEDDDILGPSGDAKFEDAFLDMMGDGGGKVDNLLPVLPAYMKFTGPMLEAFNILIESMYSKGDAKLLTHGKFEQNYTEAADELKQATDFQATEYNSKLANQINSDLTSVSKPHTPSNLTHHMKDMVEICSKYLSQFAEYNKEKGPAFRLLTQTMRSKRGEQLYQKNKLKQTYGGAAMELEKAKGLDNDHDDPNLTQDIHSSLTRLMANVTPDNMKKDMEDAIDVSSKYLSQQAVDRLERGPAFDLLIKELQQNGANPFSNYSDLATNYGVAYILSSAPGLTSVKPDPGTVPMFANLLHKVIDSATPTELKGSMQEVIDRCANYLSAFVRDREVALATLLQMMKSKPKNIFASRPTYTMDYKTAAFETETTPGIVPYLPIKDVAEEGKQALTKDMKDLTPKELEIPMKALIQDTSRHLSQPFALRSGVAGARYPMEFLAAVKKSLGQRPLFKYKAYGQTYFDAADTLMHAGPLEVVHDETAKDLHYRIKTEIKAGVPKQIADSIVKDLHPTIEDASQHLASVATEKGDTLDHLVTLMKLKGQIPLAQLQGYEQTYSDGARRIEDAPSLANNKVDKSAYESVKKKLTSMTAAKPELVPEKHAKHMPEMIELSSKFLSAPVPETNAEKRKVLGDLMAREGDNIVGEEGAYKMTHKEGGEEIRNAPVGHTAAHDAAKNKEMIAKVRTVVPDRKMMSLLKEPILEGAAHLADTIKGRGEAMKVIQEGLNKEKDKELLSVGAFNKSHEGGSKMLVEAPHFGAPSPAPALLNVVEKRLTATLSETPAHIEKQHMDDAKNIATKYIAGIATKESGLDGKALAELDEVTLLGATTRPSSSALQFDASKASTSAAAIAQGLDKSTDEKERLARLEAEQLPKLEAERRASLGKTLDGTKDGKLNEKERLAKLEAERKAKLEAERKAKLEAERLGKVDPEISASLEAERLARLEAERLAKEAEERHKESHAAESILHAELRKRGSEIFYKQPLTSLSHNQAADWLAAATVEVDKAVKESGDTSRLSKKFEKKLSHITSAVTPPAMSDNMQDVVIESAQRLAESFIATNYSAHARDNLISEMQKRANEILIEVDGAAETAFFAAQRLKKEKHFKNSNPCTEVAPRLLKRLDAIMRRGAIPRKLTPTIKEYTKDAADYLSEHVTKPDQQIEAYVALIEEMEAAGDKPLIEGDIAKSHKEAATYLRQLTTFDDKINRPNKTMQTDISNKLRSLMSNVTPTGYNRQQMDGVIKTNGMLLTSYITREAEKTKALNEMIKLMDEVGNNVLLRHGNIRKSFKNGADILRGNTTDQLNVSNVDPVVARKIEIKLNNLMDTRTPDEYKNVMSDVIQDATMYLGVHLLEPRVIKICKCMKNKFVQCEMRCEEILRRVAKPPCTCSRHISMDDMQELSTSRLNICPGTSRILAPGLKLAVTECRSRFEGNTNKKAKCQAPKPSPGCFENATTSYILDSITINRDLEIELPTRLPASSSLDNIESTMTNSPSQPFYSECSSTAKSLIMAMYTEGDADKSEYNNFQNDNNISSTAPHRVSNDLPEPTKTETQNRAEIVKIYPSNVIDNDYGYSLTSSPRKSLINFAQAKSGYTSRTPISTDKTSDWHAMLVSLLWNVEAWKKWIQENIDRGLLYQLDTDCPTGADSWQLFQRKISAEALQWRQYNIFSRKLTLRLISRYVDKEIMSEGTIKTEKYQECAQGMLEIIEMFNRWTQWLILVVKETGLIQQCSGCKLPLYAIRWYNYKMKIREYLQDWNNYNVHLKLSWEKKFETFITECIPNTSKSGPLWVMSACGAVPSGAVAAGIYDGEVVWVARTTHKRAVLPAALYPSKHCCLVYADCASYHYTKYQVMCNVKVHWVAWRGGSVHQRATQVAECTYVGRVLHRGSHLLGAVQPPLYRCQVIIFGRPFAFNFYELLVQTEELVK